MTNENENVIESGWHWSTNSFCYDSETFATQDAAIKAARKELGASAAFFIIFGKLVRLNIKDFVGSPAENAINNSLHLSVLDRDSPFDDIPLDAIHDLDKMVGEACDAWQKKHKLEFAHHYFDEDTRQKIDPVTAAANEAQSCWLNLANGKDASDGR